MLCVSKYRGVLCGFLIAALVFSTVIFPAEVHGASRFYDTYGHWAATYINTAADKGYIKGYQDGTFRPDAPVTRAEFSHMINAVLGNTGKKTVSFYDVKNGDWFYDDACKGVSAGYISGYQDGTFRPNASINRQEAASMISRVVPTYGKSGSLKQYSDGSTVDSWATSAMSRVCGKGYIGSYTDGKLHPKDSLTRGQVAKIICDISSKETITTTDPYVTSSGTRLTGRIYSNNVTIDKSLNSGDATLDNCVILGNLYVRGGGSNSVTVSNSRVAQASIEKTSSSVRLVAKGETTIQKVTASNQATIQTSSLSGGTYGAGASSVEVLRDAKINFTGDFPSVSITGADAEATFSSGTVDKLNVSTSGRNADITVESSATIADAVVDSAADFHGYGTIRYMTINSNNVTYAKTPNRVVRGNSVSDRYDEDDDYYDGDITIDPRNSEDDVDVDTDITLTFDSAMKLYNGRAITSSNIEDFVKLRRSTSGGSEIDFSASINSSDRKITIEPTRDLDDDTKYFVIIDRNELKNSSGNGNDYFSSYFYTGDEYDSDDLVTFYPRDGASNVSLDDDIEVRFSEKITSYDGSSLSTNDSALEDAFTFKGDGSRLDFSAKIDSARKVITITPEDDLEYDTDYSLSLGSREFKTASGETISSETVYWSTYSKTPSLSRSFSSITETGATLSVKPNNYSGTVYTVLSTSSSSPSSSQVEGGSVTNTVSNTKQSLSVSSNSSKSFSAFTGLTPNTTYYAYTVMRSSSSGSAYSSVYRDSFTTKTTGTPEPPTPPTTAILLDDLSVAGATKMSPSTFNSKTLNYTVTMPYGTTEATLTAKGTGWLYADAEESSPQKNTLEKKVHLSDGEGSAQITIFAADRFSTTYKVDFVAADSTEINSLKIGGSTISSDGNAHYSYEIPSSAGDVVSIVIKAESSSATIQCDAGSGMQENTGSLAIAFITSDAPKTLTFKIISSTDSSDYKEYTIALTAPPSSRKAQ